MIVHMSIRTAKPGREKDLIASMHRFGAASAGWLGFVDAKTLRDQRTGRPGRHGVLGGQGVA